MINLISCVVEYKGKLAIGANNGLLCKLKDDLKYFKHITSNLLDGNSKLSKNVVLMGRKTWFSIPRNNRPLDNRINLVLTKDLELHKLSPYKRYKKIDKIKCFGAGEGN
jgi:dihydrofolate reductase